LVQRMTGTPPVSTSTPSFSSLAVTSQYTRKEGKTHSMSYLATETIGSRKVEGSRCILQLGLRLISLLRAINYFGLVREQPSIRPNLPKCDANPLKTTVQYISFHTSAMHISRFPSIAITSTRSKSSPTASGRPNVDAAQFRTQRIIAPSSRMLPILLLHM
jgi:hypothetical protein